MDTLNDSNNNVKTPQNIDVRERVPANGDAIEQSNTLHVNACIVGGSDIQCSVCNQVSRDCFLGTGYQNSTVTKVECEIKFICECR